MQDTASRSSTGTAQSSREQAYADASLSLHLEPMKKSWLERNPLWKIPLGCLIVFVLVAAFAIILITAITSLFRHSDV